MKSWIVAASFAGALAAGSPAGFAQVPAQNVIGGGLAGAATGAAIGAIAGGGRGAATGALVGGTVGAVGGALAPAPGYAYGSGYGGYARPYRHHAAYRCGHGAHWVAGHHNRWGEWRPGHCAHNY